METPSTEAKIAPDVSAWRAASQRQLAREKALTRERDAVTRQRQMMPWLLVDTNYSFTGPEGSTSLRELFGPHEQLVVYHFMFASDWEEGCPICSFWADSFSGTERHLAARNSAFACVSGAPIESLLKYRSRMGWGFDWVSSAGTDFDRDTGVTHTPEEIESGELVYNHGTAAAYGAHSPGLSVFSRTDSGGLFLTYQTYGRGLETLNAAYSILDLTPRGRDEAGLPHPMSWVERHDQYRSAIHTEKKD